MNGFRTGRGRQSLLATASIGLMAITSAQANAQETGASDEDLLAVEEIVVTGSRIRRTSFENISQPAVVVDSEIFDKVGFVSAADALNQIPSFGVGNSGFVGAAGGSTQNIGQEFVDLFDLGTQRTLTVVNGRRFVTSNVLSADPNGRLEGSQVDINNFSPGFIERIEVLSVGGAPIYGADAISGVVNVILKDDFEGFNLDFQFLDGFNVTRRDTYSVTGEFGANTADGRGNVAASIQYANRRGVTRNQFPRFADEISIFANGGDERILGEEEGRFNILEGPTGFLPAPGPGVPLPTFGANVFTDEDGNFLTFPGTGRLEVFEPGVQTGSNPFFTQGGNGFDLDDFNEAVVPLERFTFSTLAHYDIYDNVRVFAETNFNFNRATDLISQSSEAFNTAFLNTQGQGSFGVSINNPFIVEEDRQTLIAAGAGDTIFLNGINLGLLPAAGANVNDTTTFRVVGGLQGNFEKFGRNFDWEVSMNYGRTVQSRSQSLIRGGAFFNAVDSIRLDEDSIAQLTDPDNLDTLALTTNATTINVIRRDEVLNVAPTDARVGDIICSVFLNPPGPLDRDEDNPNGNVGITNNTPTPNPDVAGCTPVNLFNGFGNPGEAIDFIHSFGLSNGRTNQADFLAFISGEAFELPAGWVQFSAGVERRRETGSLTVGGVFEDGLSRAPAIPGIPQTEIVSNEIFGEVTIPVLDAENDLGINDLLGFEFLSSMEFSGAYRLIDPSNAGTANVYSAGGTLGLLGGDLTVRGNYTRSVRQPSIVELFAPPAQGFDQTGDPCDAGNINAAPDTRRAQNCVDAARALGFDDAQLAQLGGGQVALLLSGDDNNFVTPSVNAAIPLASQGNPDLNFEIGNSYTFGFVWTPDFVPGLVVGGDYISINVRDTIVSPDFPFFTQDCFDNSNFATGDLRETCDNFSRSGVNPTPADGSAVGGFDIISGNSAFINSDTLKLEAIQGNLRYEFDVSSALKWVGLGKGESDLGSVRFNSVFYAPLVFRSSAAGLPVQPDGRVPNQVGSIGSADFGTFPELSITADITYTYGAFDFFWRTRYQDDVDACFKRIEGDCDDTPAIARGFGRDHEHDASIGYQVTDNIRLRGGVNNVLGNSRAPIEQAFAYGGNPLGRTYFLRFGYSL